MQEYPIPIALTTEEIKRTIEDHIVAAKNAIAVGFDGIELHGANGYLIEQFLNPNINTRTDEYGGTMENRARLAIDITKEISKTIGKEHIGIRFSPYNTYNDQTPYPEAEVHATYHYLALEMNKLDIAYLHIVVSPKIPEKTLHVIRRAFKNSIIQCSGLTPDTAEAALHGGFADLVAFGKTYLANPDLDQRIKKGQALNTPDTSTFYTNGAKGYTDYPILEA